MNCTTSAPISILRYDVDKELYFLFLITSFVQLAILFILF